MEQSRTFWIRRNKKKLRSEVYEGLVDSIPWGDYDVASVGKRFILPSSLTCSPIHMMQQYQDAMAIFRWKGSPNLFITFTCNPKWMEIQCFLQMYYPSQKLEDHPEVVSRVFQMKLKKMMAGISLQVLKIIVSRVFQMKLKKMMAGLKQGRYIGNIVAGIKHCS